MHLTELVERIHLLLGQIPEMAERDTLSTRKTATISPRSWSRLAYIYRCTDPAGWRLGKRQHSGYSRVSRSGPPVDNEIAATLNRP